MPRILYKLPLPDIFTAGIMVSIFLGLLLPCRGRVAVGFGWLTEVAIVTSFSDGGHIELEVAEFCVGVHVFGVSDCGVDGTRGLGTVGGWSLIFGLVIRGVSSIHCTK